MLWFVVSSSKASQSRRDSVNERMTHILRLPPGRVVTFTKLYRIVRILLVDRPGHVYAPTVVEDTLLGTALRDLLLLLLFDLGGLGLDFASTGEGSVNCSAMRSALRFCCCRRRKQTFSHVFLRRGGTGLVVAGEGDESGGCSCTVSDLKFRWQPRGLRMLLIKEQPPLWYYVTSYIRAPRPTLDSDTPVTVAATHSGGLTPYMDL